MSKAGALRSVCVAVVLCGAFNSAHSPDVVRGSGRVDRSPAPAPGGPNHGESESDELQGAENWFYGQRAFPRDHIPAQAYERARGQQARSIAEGPAAGAETPSGAAAVTAAAGPANPTWSALGPHPISTAGYASPYFGAGPISGRVTSIATSASHASVAYLGAAAGGVWKTTDGGANWTPIFDSQPGLAVGSIAVSPANENTVYVGTGEANFSGDSYFGVGLYKSTDGGGAWTKLGGSTFDNCHMGDIILKPGTPSTVVVAAHGIGKYNTQSTCQGGLYRSLDSGATWSKVLTTTAPFDLSVSPAAPTVMFAGVYSTGVFKSIDSGATWTQLGGGTSGLPNSGVYRTAVATSATDGSRVYAVLANSSTYDMSSPGGLYISSDGGSNWSRAPAYDPNLCGFGGGQCWYDLVAAVDPLNANVVYVGGSELAKYTYNAGSWSSSLIGFDPQTGIHVDMHALTFDPSATPRLWIGNDGGAYRTADGGATFANLNNDLEITEFYPGMSGSPSRGIFLAGAQDNGTNIYAGGPQWNFAIGGDGGYTATDPSNPGLVFGSYQYLHILKSVDQGGSWTEVGPNYGADSLLFIAPIEMSPTDPYTLYAGTSRLWRTTTGAAGGASSWTSIGPTTTNVRADSISAIGLSAADSRTIYTGRYGGVVQVTHDGGATWTSITSGLPVRFVTDIEVNPANANDVYVTFSGFGNGSCPCHIFHSTNGGGSWTNISGDLPDTPVNAIAIDYASGFLYAGTDVGVFSSTNGGANWADASSGLPHTVVMDLMIDSVPDGSRELLAATHGRGAFAATIVAAPCHRSGGAMSISIPANDTSYGIVRSGNDLRVSGTKILDPTCGGATVDNVQTVAVASPEGGEVFTIDASGGAFVSSTNVDTKFTVDLGLGSDEISLRGGLGVDRFTLGSTGINLDNDADADVTPTGVERTRASTGDANDYVSAAGAAGTGGTSARPLIASSGAGNDTLVGGTAVDTLSGDEGSDLVRGGRSGDALAGGNGTDVVEYLGSTSGVSVNLGAATVSGGFGTGDVITGFESVTGSSMADTLTGGWGANVIKGGAGADKLDGGAGVDTLIYAGSPSGVTVNLGANTASGGDASAIVNGATTNDSITGFENVTGSSFADSLTGSTAVNILRGDRGVDTLRGGGANDSLYGSYADDHLFGDVGDDYLDGGPNDTANPGDDCNDVTPANPPAAFVNCETIRDTTIIVSEPRLTVSV